MLKDYYGVFSSTPEKFYVLPGHIKLLLAVVDFIKVNRVTKSVDFLSVKSKPIQQREFKIS